MKSTNSGELILTITASQTATPQTVRGRRSVTVTRYLLGFLAAPVVMAASAARRR